MLPARLGIGRSATPAELRAWNIDANASGVGLPAGRGTYDRGAALFDPEGLAGGVELPGAAVELEEVVL